jgi:mono/diheme cytochrome c family protein
MSRAVADGTAAGARAGTQLAIRPGRKGSSMSIKFPVWIGVGLLLACGSGESEAPQPAAPAPKPTAAAPAAPQVSAHDQAQQIFSTRCFVCHGPQGKGDGPGSKGLTPPPRNFQDPEWQASVSDQHIEQIIQYGGTAVGRSPTMPSNPDLMSKPQVVAAIREHIRSLAP